MNGKKTPKATFATHLQELRTRLIWIAIFFIIFSFVSFQFYNTILDFLVRPIGQTLYFTSPAGGFDIMIRICLISGFILTVPVILYHLFRFLEPLSKKGSKRSWVIIVSFSALLASIGISFAYFIGLPAALIFLKGFGGDGIEPLITAQEYFAFITYYLLGFAVAFQLPVILLTFNSMKPLKLSLLLSYSKYIILLSVIAAAIITPTTDIFNLLLLAIPLVALYFVSVGLIYFVNIRTRKN